MARVTVSFTEHEKSWLERRSRETGESISEIVRQAIRRMQNVHELEATRGLWRRGDGLRYQRKIRGEWEWRTSR